MMWSYRLWYLYFISTSWSDKTRLFKCLFSWWSSCWINLGLQISRQEIGCYFLSHYTFYNPLRIEGRVYFILWDVQVACADREISTESTWRAKLVLCLLCNNSLTQFPSPYPPKLASCGSHQIPTKITVNLLSADHASVPRNSYSLIDITSVS